MGSSMDGRAALQKVVRAQSVESRYRRRGAGRWRARREGRGEGGGSYYAASAALRVRTSVRSRSDGEHRRGQPQPPAPAQHQPSTSPPSARPVPAVAANSSSRKWMTSSRTSGIFTPPLPARRTSTTRTPPSNTANMSAPSLAPMIMKRPWLQRWMKPLANWYNNASGYRQLGLRYAAPWASTGNGLGTKFWGLYGMHWMQ